MSKYSELNKLSHDLLIAKTMPLNVKLSSWNKVRAENIKKAEENLSAVCNAIIAEPNSTENQNLKFRAKSELKFACGTKTKECV